MRDVRREFEYNFTGMTVEPVGLDTLLAARERMMRELQQGLTAMSAGSLVAGRRTTRMVTAGRAAIWHSFLACAGSWKTSSACGTLMPGNSLRNRRACTAARVIHGSWGRNAGQQRARHGIASRDFLPFRRDGQK